jgi:hypothetical protein
MENPVATIPYVLTPRPGRPWKRIMKWVAFSVLVLILLLVLAGFTYNAIAQHAESLRFPQQGKSVQLGHRIQQPHSESGLFRTSLAHCDTRKRGGCLMMVIPSLIDCITR